MAKKRDKELFDRLRDNGVRKKVAKAARDSSAQAPGKQADLVAKTARGLRKAASDLERHAAHASRSDTAKKAARTRKRNADQRSAGARKAARTRAKAN